MSDATTHALRRLVRAVERLLLTRSPTPARIADLLDGPLDTAKATLRAEDLRRLHAEGRPLIEVLGEDDRDESA